MIASDRFQMKNTLALVLMVFGNTFLFGNEINLKCDNNYNSQDIKAVIINPEKKSFFVSGNYDLLRFEEDEIVYQGINDDFISRVTIFEINRITLKLTYILRDRSLGNITKRASGQDVPAFIDKKEYSCNQVTKI
tara:strand:- start:837 stop:1241 length:405 start_codon:yes stop_codon:yes gene_type:complete